jgi:hypothetical protein
MASHRRSTPNKIDGSDLQLGVNPDATFDSFLNQGVRVISSEVRDWISASDHNPVVLKISLP